MNELVRIAHTNIGDESVETVNARELHGFLGVGKDFSTWIKSRIEQYGFTEDQDYILTFPKTGERGNVKLIEYHLSIDMAKELSMVERNEKGRQARKYFIECEKRWKMEVDITPSVTSGARCFKELHSVAELLGLDKNASAISANTAVRKITGVDTMALLGISGLIAEKQERLFTPTELGKDKGMSAQVVNKILNLHDLQEKVNGLWIPTEKGRQYCRLIDSGKRHSDGSTIQQIKWLESVIPVILDDDEEEIE